MNKYCVLGFNGTRADPASGTTHLGNGYRAYNPILMRFHCPDNLSPFGIGGINPYVYCDGDPVNRADPSGHHSLWGWMAIAAGVALGALLTPVSGGSPLAVALSIADVSTAVISTGLAVAQQFVEESAPKTAAALGWAALGTGTVSGISSAALSCVAPGANSLVSLLKGTSNRPFGGLMMEGGAVQQRAGASGHTLAIDIFTSNERNLLNKGGIKTQRFNGPLYRSDNRPPETIFEQGFQAKGLNGNYNDHFMNSARTGKSHFISFTDDIECAKKFAKPKQCFPPFSSYFPKGPHHSYIYEVDHLDYALDLKHLYGTENEIAAVSSVPTHHIKGAHTYLSINQIPRPQGFITNPNYIL